jgi:adiponectin receptor
VRWSSLLLRNPSNDDSYRKIEEQQAVEADTEAQTIEFIYNLEPKQKTKAFVGSYDQYPEILRDNECLRTGYRCEFNTWADIWKSLFMWHNETVNVWSHMLGCIGFIIAVFVVIFGFNNMAKDGIIMLQ